MKHIVKHLLLLTVAMALPLTTLAAPNATPPKQPLLNVQLAYVHVKAGQLSFKLIGRFVKSSNEVWTVADDQTMKDAILLAFSMHRNIDVTNYTLPTDNGSNTIIVKGITLERY